MKNTLTISSLLLFILFLIVACEPTAPKKKDNTNDIFFNIETKSTQMVMQRPGEKMSAVPEYFDARIGKYETDKNKFGVFVVDRNRDKIFNERGIDLIGLIEYELDTILNHRIEKLNRVNYVEVNDEKFRLSKVSEDGKNAQIELVNVESLKPDLRLYEKLPNASFTDLYGNQHQFHDFLNQDDKLIYVMFWGLWAVESIKVMPLMKELHEKHANKIILISMAWGSKQEDIQSFGETVAMNWVNALSTEEINRLFGQGPFPHGVLFNAQGKLLKFGIRPDRLVNILEGNNAANTTKATIKK